MVEGKLLDRGRCQFFAAPPGAVRLGDHPNDAVAGVKDLFHRGEREFRRSHKNHIQAIQVSEWLLLIFRNCGSRSLRWILGSLSINSTPSRWSSSC